MAEHRGVCGREEVACPCPGCEVRGARSEVEEHVEASGAVHLRSAWRKVAEMEATVVEQGRQIAAQAESIAEQVRGQQMRVVHLGRSTCHAISGPLSAGANDRGAYRSDRFAGQRHPEADRG